LGGFRLQFGLDIPPEDVGAVFFSIIARAVRRVSPFPVSANRNFSFSADIRLVLAPASLPGWNAMKESPGSDAGAFSYAAAFSARIDIRKAITSDRKYLTFPYL
jgi:hypothetical protein